MALFPPLNKRNMRDKAKGLCITSEKHIGELGARCLSQQLITTTPLMITFARDSSLHASRMDILTQNN